jgi:hypothetical protein
MTEVAAVAGRAEQRAERRRMMVLDRWTDGLLERRSDGAMDRISDWGLVTDDQ